MNETTGQDLLDIANGSWNSEKQRYRGFQYSIAVGQAKKGIEKVRGGKKDRLNEARHQVSVLFDHARRQTPKRLGNIASEASLVLVSTDGGQSFSAGSELTLFASEVTDLLNGPHNGGYGVIDPTMIINLIVAIVSAIKACKQVIPTPTPTPVTP